VSDTFEHHGLRIVRNADGTFWFGTISPFTRADLATIIAFAANRSGTEEGQREARQDILQALEILPAAKRE
jgi:hypothetical protein